MEYQNEFNTNRETWNKKVAVHAKSDFYDLDGFKKGAVSLNVYEINALGDVRDKSMLHLQCHFGLDTLSWARRGARCTGVDFSEKGIELATSINDELGLDARFVCCNVYDTSKFIPQTFDIVFTSYGVLGWLPKLKPWAEMIAQRLNPGGVFYIAEFHPIVWMFDYRMDPPRMRYGYQQEAVIYETYEGTYTDKDDKRITSKEYGWNHGLGELFTALTDAGLRVELFREHHGAPYNVFPGLVKTIAGLYERPDRLYPLVFEMKARKA